jgi:hypothetical protein
MAVRINIFGNKDFVIKFGARDSTHEMDYHYQCPQTRTVAEQYLVCGMKYGCR